MCLWVRLKLSVIFQTTEVLSGSISVLSGVGLCRQLVPLNKPLKLLTVDKAGKCLKAQIAVWS